MQKQNIRFGASKAYSLGEVERTQGMGKIFGKLPNKYRAKLPCCPLDTMFSSSGHKVEK